ncbi:hypothetical protein Droror1_Dr00009829 [Drosera rotundifolia]
MDMYSKFGAVVTTRSIFDGLDDKTMVIRNSMIDEYAQNRDLEEAPRLLRRLLDKGVEPTNVTIIIEALHAYVDCSDLELEKFIMNCWIKCFIAIFFVRL